MNAPPGSDQARESVWVACFNEVGKKYYFNKESGKVQWEKPVDIQDVGSKVKQTGVVKAPPPKPKSAVVPPPRPKQVASARVKTDLVGNEAAMKASELGGLLFTGSQARMRDPVNVSEGVDPDTGFGEWEPVLGEVFVSKGYDTNVSELDLFRAMKDEARYGSGLTAHPRLEKVQINTASSDLAEDEPVSFRRVAKKKARHHFDPDD